MYYRPVKHILTNFPLQISAFLTKCRIFRHKIYAWKPCPGIEKISLRNFVYPKICTKFAALKHKWLDPWCNGSTPVFGTVSRGSSPCGSTKKRGNTDTIWLPLFFLPHSVQHIAIPLPRFRWLPIHPPCKPGKAFGFKSLDNLGGMMLDVPYIIDMKLKPGIRIPFKSGWSLQG